MERRGEYRRPNAKVGSYFAEPEYGFVGSWWAYQVTGRRLTQNLKTNFKIDEWKGWFNVFDYGPRYTGLGYFPSLWEALEYLGNPLVQMAMI